MKHPDLLFLQSHQEYPSVSILVKTHRTMPEREQDPIRVKNAVQETKDRLLKEYSVHDTQQIFKNLDEVVRSINYASTLDGLAIFVNKHVKLLYYLPVEITNKVVIDDTFVSRDIVYALNRLPHYWVLSLGEKPTRLYKGYGEDLIEIVEPVKDLQGNDQDGFPYSFLPPNIEDKRELLGDNRHRNRFNSSSVNSSQNAGGTNITVGRDAAFIDSFYRKFFSKIDELLGRFLHEKDGHILPLVVVGAERTVEHFKQISNYKDRIIAHKKGNYEDCTPSHVAERVWPLVQEYLAQQVKETLEKFEENAIGANQHAIGLDGVWRVAQDGRVRILLVEKDFSVGGVVNSDNKYDLLKYENAKAKHISDDLVNVLIELVIQKGGDVVFCEPGDLEKHGHITAILRY